MMKSLLSLMRLGRFPIMATTDPVEVANHVLEIVRESMRGYSATVEHFDATAKELNERTSILFADEFHHFQRETDKEDYAESINLSFGETAITFRKAISKNRTASVQIAVIPRFPFAWGTSVSAHTETGSTRVDIFNQQPLRMNLRPGKTGVAAFPVRSKHHRSFELNLLDVCSPREYLKEFRRAVSEWEEKVGIGRR